MCSSLFAEGIIERRRRTIYTHFAGINVLHITSSSPVRRAKAWEHKKLYTIAAAKAQIHFSYPDVIRSNCWERALRGGFNVSSSLALVRWMATALQSIVCTGLAFLPHIGFRLVYFKTSFHRVLFRTSHRTTHSRRAKDKHVDGNGKAAADEERTRNIFSLA